MAKSARRPAADAVKVPAHESASRALNESLVEVTERDIARRAFELYCQRGRQHGQDADDWLQAERELRDPVRVTASSGNLAQRRS
jgi:putative NADPH-quinone reductase